MMICRILRHVSAAGGGLGEVGIWKERKGHVRKTFAEMNAIRYCYCFR